MEKDSATIKCPECGTEINVNDVIYHQLEDQLKQDFEQKTAQQDKDYKEKFDELKKEKAALLEEKNNQAELVQTEVQTKLKEEKSKLEKTIRARVDEEKSDQLKTLEDELKQKSEQLKELNKTKADLARVQREKEELRDSIIAEQEKKFNELLNQEREKIRASEGDKTRDELQKRDKLISDLNKKLEEAQHKLEQGSNKLFGEVKEIELREFLRQTCPMDEIKDIPSGMTGADVIQVVRNNIGQESGVILYERKETQRFDEKWVSKLKENGRTVKADICVIVTKTMPTDESDTHFRDGVWVCTFADIELLVVLLRDGLLKQYSALATQAGKGTKMEMLYDYLRSNDFKNHIMGILDAFNKMDKSLIKEKEAALKKFSEREAHIFQAKQSILSFWGRVDGIAIDSLSAEVKMLDESYKNPLPDLEFDEE